MTVLYMLSVFVYAGVIHEGPTGNKFYCVGYHE